MIRYLLANGADVNQREGRRSLYLAVIQDNTAIVRLLLEFGSDPNFNRRPANEAVDDIMRR